MRRYRATSKFYFGQLGEFSKEDNFQKIAKDEIIGELEDSIGLYLKNQVVRGIELGSQELSYLIYVDTVEDPPLSIGAKNNFDAIVDPTVNDDSSEGYSIGSEWVNTSSGDVFVCVDDTEGAAVWSTITTPEVKNSIEVDGGALQFVNDEASPGIDEYYGTDDLGDKGWQETEVFDWTSVDGSTVNIDDTDSPYTVLPNSYQMVRIDCSSGNVILNLPSSLTYSGRSLYFKRLSGGVNTITINADGVETIDGSASFSLSGQYDCLIIRSYGNGWDVI